MNFRSKCKCGNKNNNAAEDPMRQMKMIFSVLFLVMVIPFGIKAQNITDLMFMPGKGKIVVEPSFDLSRSHSEVSFSYFGTSIDSESDFTESLFSLSGYYGITDSFAIGLSEAYSSSDDKTTTTFWGMSDSSTTKSKGMNDPEFMILYRFLTAPVILDFNASYSPKLFKSKSATDENDGTMGKGAHSFDFGIDAGQKIERFSYALRFFTSLSTERTVEGEDGDTKSKGGHGLSAVAEIQYLLTDSFFLRGHAGYMYITKSTSTSYDDSTSRQDGFGSYFAGAGIGFVLVPETALVNLNMSYIKSADFTTTETDSSGDSLDIKVKNTYAMSFSASVMYKF